MDIFMQIKLFQFIIEAQVSEPSEVQNIDPGFGIDPSAIGDSTMRSINMNKKKNVNNRYALINN